MLHGTNLDLKLKGLVSIINELFLAGKAHFRKTDAWKKNNNDNNDKNSAHEL